MEFSVNRNFSAELKLAVRAGLERASMLLVDGCQQVLSVTTERTRVKYKRPRAKVLADGSVVWQRTHLVHTVVSKEGEPPRKRTGWGAAHVGYQIIDQGELTARVGVPQNAIYLGYHEAGIRYPTRGPNKGTGAPIKRPWLVVTFNRLKPAMWQAFLTARSR